MILWHHFIYALVFWLVICQCSGRVNPRGLFSSLYAKSFERHRSRNDSKAVKWLKRSDLTMVSVVLDGAEWDVRSGLSAVCLQWTQCDESAVHDLGVA